VADGVRRRDCHPPLLWHWMSKVMPGSLEIPYAVKSEPSKKDQDRHAFLEKDGVAAFGIFDGHGGIDTSQALKEGLLPKLVAQGYPTDKQIVDAFWTIDEVCGTEMAARKCHAGSTCTVLLVSDPGKQSRRKSRLSRSMSRMSVSSTDKPGDYKCKLAWCGDSNAHVIDMKAETTKAQLAIKMTPHTPYEESEKKQLLQMAAVCKAVRKLQGKGEKDEPAAKAEEPTADGEGAAEGAPPEGRRGSEKGEAHEEEGASETEDEVRASQKEAEEDEVDEALVLQAFQQLGLQVSTEELQLYKRALRREKIIQKAIPRNSKYRRRCFIHKRAKKKDANQPLVVATAEDPLGKHHKDLMMTRSICDWTKCAWVLPHPQTLEFTVGLGEHKRILIASDGLWDVCGAEFATVCARDNATVDQVVEALMNTAIKTYKEDRKLEKMGDDTTVMVIDLNPSHVAFEQRSAFATCCAVFGAM